MTPILSRALAAIRVWLGLNDPVENRLHPSHGWLLPLAADARARAFAPSAYPAAPQLVCQGGSAIKGRL